MFRIEHNSAELLLYTTHVAIVYLFLLRNRKSSCFSFMSISLFCPGARFSKVPKLRGPFSVVGMHGVANPVASESTFHL